MGGNERPGTGKETLDESRAQPEWPWEGSSHPAMYSVIARGGVAAAWNLRASWAAGESSCLISQQHSEAFLKTFMYVHVE